MNTLFPWIALSCTVLSSCSHLPVPGEMEGVSGADPKEILELSAKAHGDLYRMVHEVEVSYDGEWTGFAKRVQPVLVDAGYRKASTERYITTTESVTQKHLGPEGEKLVCRDPMSVKVIYDGVVNKDGEVNDAAALVADAYTMFLFGTSYLTAHGSDLAYVGTKQESGRTFHLIQGTLVPGIGFSMRDDFIAWIPADTKLLHRIQFTLNGLESTRGADVSVVFSDYVDRSGFLLPRVFVEYVERPIHAKAHQWEMTDFRVIGRR